MTDEQFVAIAALDDDGWCEFMLNNPGLDVRPHPASPEAGVDGRADAKRDSSSIASVDADDLR